MPHRLRGPLGQKADRLGQLAVGADIWMPMRGLSIGMFAAGRAVLALPRCILPVNSIVQVPGVMAAVHHKTMRSLRMRCLWARSGPQTTAHSTGWMQ